MQNSRDSSVWRSLAVAFGDGVAFGVGMKLTSAPKPSAPKLAAPQPEVLPDRTEEFERRIAQLEARPAPSIDHKVLEAVVTAVDARLREHAAQIEQRLLELEKMIALDLKTLAEQDQTVAAFVKDNLDELQEQFAGQIAAVRRELADISVPGRDRELLDLLNGVGDLVRQAADRIADTRQPVLIPEPPVPAFTAPLRPRGLWRVPVVSSMVIVTGVIAIAHYL